MKQVTELFGQMNERLDGLVRANAVVAKTISVGDRHVIPLCELGLGFGVGGGQGEAEEEGQGRGSGGGAGGGAKATPVAVIVVDGGKVRVETLGG